MRGWVSPPDARDSPGAPVRRSATGEVGAFAGRSVQEVVAAVAHDGVCGHRLPVVARIAPEPDVAVAIYLPVAASEVNVNVIAARARQLPHLVPVPAPLAPDLKHPIAIGGECRYRPAPLCRLRVENRSAVLVPGVPLLWGRVWWSTRTRRTSLGARRSTDTCARSSSESAAVATSSTDRTSQAPSTGSAPSRRFFPASGSSLATRAAACSASPTRTATGSPGRHIPSPRSGRPGPATNCEDGGRPLPPRSRAQPVLQNGVLAERQRGQRAAIV